MNLPTGTAVQRRGVAFTQFQCVSRVGNPLLRFSNDHAVDTDAPRQDPLLGTSFWRVGMRLQQPVQQGLGRRFHH